jgi:hypothetical protein
MKTTGTKRFCTPQGQTEREATLERLGNRQLSSIWVPHDNEGRKIRHCSANSLNLELVCDMPLSASAREAGSQPIQSVCRQGTAGNCVKARRENLSPLAGGRKASKPGIT